MRSRFDSSQRPLLYIVVLALLACLRFVALSADFPLDLGSYGMAYTDEGWWSRNAVAWVREGNWYIDDGYNTITNLPVLPLIQVVWFKLFGVGLVSARVITVVCSLIVSVWVYLFARRELSVDFAWIAPLVVLTNYPTFAYNRLALLEMPMLVFLLVSLWLVSMPQKRSGPFVKRPLSRVIVAVVVSGLCFALAVLTKTTALFALPVVAIALCLQDLKDLPDLRSVQKQWVRTGQNWRHPVFIRGRFLLIWLLSVGVLIGVFSWVVSQAGDTQSQTYFADHNVAAKVPKTLFDFLKGPLRVVERSFTLFPLLFPCSLGAIFLLVKDGKLTSSPLFRLAVLWTGAALCAFSLSDYAAPRYFLVLIVPMSLVIPLWLETLWKRYQLNGSLFVLFKRVPLVSLLIMLTFLASTGSGLLRMGHYLRQPQFSLVETASAIDRYIKTDQSRSNVVLGSFADTIALAAADVKAVNDRMGFRPLTYRLETFEPSYYLSIGPVGFLDKKHPDIEPTLTENYRLVLIDQFDLYQQRDFEQPIFFYRLEPRISKGTQ